MKRGEEGRTPLNRSEGIPVGASMAIIHLFKGVVYLDSNEEAWRELLDHQAYVRDYLDVVNLDLTVDEAEGYAFVRQIDKEPSEVSGEHQIPRLVARRPLGYGVSLLCVLLRKRLVEHDSSGGDVRLVLSREQMIDLVRVFLPNSSNEARIEDLIDQAIGKLTDYGILRRLRSEGDSLFEVKRIIKALVDATWLAEMNIRLEGYKKHADDTL